MLDVLLYGLIISGVYSLISVGFSMAFGVMNALNVAQGDMLMIGAYITFWLFSLYGINPFLSFPLSFLILFAIGTTIGKLLLNPLSAKSRSSEQFIEASLLLFFGFSILLQNIAFLLWKADYRGFSYLDAPIAFFGVSIAPIRVIAAVMSALALLSLYLFLLKTRAGKSIRAIAQNKERAMLLGINVNRLNAIAFGISAAIAGLAGSIISPLYAINPAIGTPYTIKALCVAVMGGLGSIKGVMAAALVLGLSESFGSLFIGAGLKDAIGYLFLLLTLLLRPQGLFRR